MKILFFVLLLRTIRKPLDPVNLIFGKLATLKKSFAKLQQLLAQFASFPMHQSALNMKTCLHRNEMSVP